MEFMTETSPGKARKRQLGLSPGDQVVLVVCDDIMTPPEQAWLVTTVCDLGAGKVDWFEDPETFETIAVCDVAGLPPSEHAAFAISFRAAVRSWQVGETKERTVDASDPPTRAPAPPTTPAAVHGRHGSPAGPFVAIAPPPDPGPVQAVALRVLPHLGKDIVVFDLEIAETVEQLGGWTKAKSEASVSVVCTFDFLDGRIHVYDVNTLPEFIERVKAAALVVGFNQMEFDYKILRNKTQGFNFRRIKAGHDVDIYAAIKEAQGSRRAKGWTLDSCCEGTIGAGKTWSGADAPTWWQNGRYGQVADYCSLDVLLTRDLYLIACENDGWIRSGDNDESLQIDLFPISEL